MSDSPPPRLPMWKKILGLLSDAAVYGASSVLSQVIGFILLPVYSRFLTPQDYGIVAMLAVLTTLFVPLANLGMNNAVFRFFNVSKDDFHRSNVLTIGMVTVVACSTVLGVLGMFYAESISTFLIGVPDYANLVRLSVVSAMFNSVAAQIQVVFRADRRVKAMASFNIANVIITATVTVFLLLVVGMRAEGVVLGILAGDIVITVAMYAASFRRFPLLIHDTTQVRPMFRYGLPLVPHHLQTMGFMFLAQYIVRTYMGLGDAGLYSMAMKLAVPFTFAVGAIQRAWVPYKFQIHAEDEDPRLFFRTVVTYYVAGMCYLWLGVSVWGPEMLRLMTDVQFHAAAPLVPFVAAITLARGLRFMLGTGIELGDDTRLIPVASFCGLVTAGVAGIGLLKLWGIPGAALGTTLAWLVMAAILYGVAQKRFRINYDWPVLGTVLLVSCVLVAIDNVAQDTLNVWGRLALALVFSLVYPAIAFVVLARSETERARMKVLLDQIRRRLRRQPAEGA